MIHYLNNPIMELLKLFLAFFLFVLLETLKFSDCNGFSIGQAPCQTWGGGGGGCPADFRIWLFKVTLIWWYAELKAILIQCIELVFLHYLFLYSCTFIVSSFGTVSIERFCCWRSQDTIQYFRWKPCIPSCIELHLILLPLL